MSRSSATRTICGAGFRCHRIRLRGNENQFFSCACCSIEEQLTSSGRWGLKFSASGSFQTWFQTSNKNLILSDNYYFTPMMLCYQNPKPVTLHLLLPCEGRCEHGIPGGMVESDRRVQCLWSRCLRCQVSNWQDPSWTYAGLQGMVLEMML